MPDIMQSNRPARITQWVVDVCAKVIGYNTGQIMFFVTTALHVCFKWGCSQLLAEN